MTTDVAYGFFGALKNSLSALSDVITSAGPVPADAPAGSLFLSTEKVTSDGNDDCSVYVRIRYFAEKMVSGDDGGILNAIGRISFNGKEIAIQKFECRHCGRYLDVTAVYSFPSFFFGYVGDDGGFPVMSSVTAEITFC